MKKNDVYRWIQIYGIFFVLLSGCAHLHTEESESVVFVAGSDFQALGGHDESAKNVEKILTEIKKNHEKIDGFFFGGDADCDSIHDENETKKGISALMSAIQSVYPNIHDANAYLVQGNHDAMIDDFDKGGQHDREDIGIYLIHEDDYMYGTMDEERIKETGVKLKQYLDERVEKKDRRVIFIISHMPLHFSGRTIKDGDASYAHDLFDPINEAAKEGLNIIYLYGHNHIFNFDGYLGGSAVFLKKGDQLWIAERGSQTECTMETLYFTYMNAGYMGYYGYHATPSYETATLTMSVFEVFEDHVTIWRYSENEKEALKRSGSKNSYYDREDFEYKENEKIYMSPQIVNLNE